jgi:hypothetical protein
MTSTIYRLCQVEERCEVEVGFEVSGQVIEGLFDR